MKINVKKALATLAAAAMIVTSVQCPAASAAKKPALNSKKITLKTGQKKTLKVKNKIKGSKYTWKSSKPKVAKVSQKGVVKAVKAGTATVTCKVKTKATKKKKAKTYTLKCTVTVKKKSTVKPTPKPTAKPTAKPTDTPSTQPTDTPTQQPSDNPSAAPSTIPSASPSAEPSASPSASPSTAPSASPSAAPSANPSAAPGGYYHPSRPSSTSAPAEVTAKTQEALNEALKANTAKKLIIDSTETTLTIGEGSHPNMDVVVKAPNATITNSATFKSITIEKINGDTWIEQARNNTIIVTAAEAHISLAAGAEGTNIEVGKPAGTEVTKKPNITITANGGKANEIKVKAVVNLSIAKGTTTGSDAIKVTVAIDASGKVGEETTATINSEVKVEVDTKGTTTQDIKVGINFTEGAEGSKVESDTTAGNIGVVNNTTQDVTVDSSAVTTGNATGNAEVTAEAQLAPIVAAIEKYFDGKDLTNVTGDLALPSLTADLGVNADNASKFSISWTTGGTGLTVDSTKATATQTPQKQTATLKATVTLTDNGKTYPKDSKVFDIIIPAATDTPAGTVTVDLSSVSYTTSGSAVAASGGAISSSASDKITITEPTPTVKEGTTDVATGKYKITYMLDTQNSAIPTSGFAESGELTLDSTGKYLWIKVTVTKSDNTTEDFYFASTNADASAKTITLAERKKNS